MLPPEPNPGTSSRRKFLRDASLGVLAIAASPQLAACTGTHGGKPTPGAPDPHRRHWIWTSSDPNATEEALARRLDEIGEAGVGGLHVAGADPRFHRLARARGFEVHAWIWTLCRGDRELRERHPDWYAVSRDGISTLEDPPYVDYYRFLCPTRAGVREHLTSIVSRFADLPDLDGIHLDYVRYPDVILPKALWARYGLVQDRELPRFDFCYCSECRESFRRESGEDPLALPDPPSDPRWRAFREARITSLVNHLAATVRRKGKRLSAAVFPTPAIARKLVRQDWSRWDLDAVFPMIYHRFYDEPIDWIGEAVRAGRAALPPERPLYAGLYLPDLGDPEDFERAVRTAMAGGASGVSLFGGVRPIPRG